MPNPAPSSTRIHRPSVRASVDALDDDPAPDPDPAFLGQKLLDALKEEERFWRKQKKSSDNSRAHSVSVRYENFLKDHYAENPEFYLWDENRALDRQNFDYLFFHRHHFHRSIQTCLEIIASKITHETQDGDAGYFKKLERNIGWTAHITPIVFAQSWFRDHLVRCGLWSSASNSHRCHKTDLCALCLWNDHLKVLVDAFGERSGAFANAPAWWFVTLGFTTNPNNSKWQVKGFGEQGREEGDEDRSYDAYPVRLGPSKDDPTTEPYDGYNDGRLLGLIVQEALDNLYQTRIVDGYRNKLEGAFSLGPGLGNRMNMHGHAVANGRETDSQYVAEQIYAQIIKGLEKYREAFSRAYYPDVQVCPIESPEHLVASLEYQEKVVAVDRIVAEAMTKPEAKLANGRWNPRYAFQVETSLYQLIQEDIPAIFTCFKHDHELLYLRRRKTVGNMTFTDRGTCIGREPRWHIKVRRKNAQKTREARKRSKERAAEARTIAASEPPTDKQNRTRTKPRRLKRSLRQQFKEKSRSGVQPIAGATVTKAPFTPSPDLPLSARRHGVAKSAACPGDLGQSPASPSSGVAGRSSEPRGDAVLAKSSGSLRHDAAILAASTHKTSIGSRTDRADNFCLRRKISRSRET